MRGEGQGYRLYAHVLGITPACAGRSTVKLMFFMSAPDHPRVCGEKLAGAGRVRLSLGSPPRVRGEVIVEHLHKLNCRITPACAGRSFVSESETRTTWDHPRVCGEKAVVNPKCQSDRGSPPRVRGEGGGKSKTPIGHRITPACAGRSR